jgi:uncharacterized lipoprotein YehR (DUF1307 family)
MKILKKRVFAIFVLIGIIIAVAGCDNGNSANDNSYDGNSGNSSGQGIKAGLYNKAPPISASDTPVTLGARTPLCWAKA